jgi:hypothetical protein
MTVLTKEGNSALFAATRSAAEMQLSQKIGIWHFWHFFKKKMSILSQDGFPFA